MHLRKSNFFKIIFILALGFSAQADIKPKEEIIQHPGAEQGLVRIKKDGTYVYEVERKKTNTSGSFRFGQANQPEISVVVQEVDANGNATGNEKLFNFEDFYDSNSGFLIGYDYEKFLYETGAGKLGYQAGASAMFASGHGRLVATPNGPSQEKFTFVTMPINLGAIYRMQFKPQQMFVPYAAGGGTYTLLIEKREDLASPKAIGSFGFYGAGGLLYNLASLDDEMGFELENEYGISNMWLAIEFRAVEVNAESFVFSNQYISAGLSFDF